MRLHGRSTPTESVYSLQVSEAPRAKRNGRGTIIQGHKEPKGGNNAHRPLQANSPPDASIAGSPTSPLPANEHADFFVELLHDYNAYVFPFSPIITASEAKDAIATMHEDREAQAFVYALCAVTLSLAHSFGTSEADEPAVIVNWLSRAMAALPGVLSLDSFTIRRIVLIDFIHISLAGLGRFEPAHHYLRQSISMVEALKLADTGTLETLPPPERARRQRLYYLIFVHERYFALFHHHLISMTNVDWLPEIDDTISHQISVGFNQIISLFLHIDADMISAWLSITDDTARVDPDWIQKKHRELEAEPAGDLEHIASLRGMQQADLIITKHWMRMLLWQIALSKCLLSSSSNEAMSLLFPVGVSTQLRALFRQVSRQEISIQGSGIQQKLFEMTDIIAGVVLTIANVSPAAIDQYIEDFRSLFDFWKTLPRLNATQLEILLEKDQKINALTLQSPIAETPGSSATI